jgi:hypothetical protein
MTDLTPVPPSAIITAPLTPEQARELTEEVRNDIANLWLKVLMLFEGAAHAALDYESWREYWEAEFGTNGTRGEQYIRAGRVCRALAHHGLQLPGNDATARALTPILRTAPGELPDVWRKALEESDGKPTGAQVRKLAEPYRETRPTKVERSADGRSIRRLRNAVGGRVRDVHNELEAANKAVEAALLTCPPDTLVRDWLHHAEEAMRELETLTEALRNRA